jgi:hypothetical protein
MTDPITPPPELVQQWIDLPLSEEERLIAAYRAGAVRYGRVSKDLFVDVVLTDFDV